MNKEVFVIPLNWEAQKSNLINNGLEKHYYNKTPLKVVARKNFPMGVIGKEVQVSMSKFEGSKEWFITAHFKNYDAD